MFKREHFTKQDMSALLRELARLRAENKMLRQQRPASARYSQTVKEAVADAHTLIMCAFSGEATGQDHMRQKHGVTRARWQWATATLRMAGIIKNPRHWQRGMIWITTDIDQSVQLLEKTATALDAPDGYQRLKMARFHVE